MGYFQDKIVWVTGASSGIGEALAVELNLRGAILVLSARRKEELERVQSRTHFPARVLVLPFDLTDLSVHEAKTRDVINQFGRIDILINNGGISHRSYAIETPLEVTRKIVELDFFSYVSLTKAVLPYFIKQKSGQIGVVSSLAGKTGVKRRSAYSAAKHALLGYFNSLRAELKGDNIGVTIFCPGAIRTNISLHALLADGSENNKLEKNIANGISPEKFAKIVLNGLSRKKAEVYNGGKDNLIVFLQRLFPSYFAKLVAKSDF